MTMYDRIKDLCEANGFAISFLADHVPNLEINPSSINAWKNGSVPRKRKLYQIADYFGVTPEYLLTGEQPETQADEVYAYMQGTMPSLLEDIERQIRFKKGDGESQSLA